MNAVRRAASLITVVLMTVVAAPAATASVAKPAPHSWYPFAPYAEVSQYPSPNYATFRRAAGVRAITLAFVTAKQSSRCVPTWGGFGAYPAYGSSAYQRSELNAFRAKGGRLVASFGGASGAELATVCKSVGALKAAYAKVVDAYGVNHLDFDIEGGDVANFEAAKRRAAALSALQKSARKTGHPLRISLTLPVLPSGLTGDSQRIVLDTVRGGVSISLVNGMAMDYGDSAAPHPSGKMGTYAVDVAKALHRQLRAIFFKPRAAAIASMIGITPMIGINDVSDEVFTANDAKQLRNFASQQHLGMLSFWQLGRDRQCPTPTHTASDSCSGVNQSPWTFSKLLRR
jgi:hypothetical protein